MKPILYVDDEEQNLAVFEAAFEDDYDVVLASSGREALEILGERPIPLVISDMRMPEMTGVELLERMIPDHPDTVRMILTGYTDIDAIIQAINGGRVYQYVTKPWDEKSLRTIIDKALDQYQSVQEQKDLLARLAQQERDERALRDIFRRYVPPAVVDQAIELGTGGAAGPTDAESRLVTFLFADVRGFTTLCSGRDPRDVLKLMNAYYEAMAGAIHAHGGTVSRFLGDGLLAMFGAPEPDPDAERNAAQAAIAMIEALAVFNREQAPALGAGDLAIGVGLQRGEVVVGNLGSADRLEYSAVGNALNQVWQIEAQSKGRPNAILISDELRQHLGPGFVTEKLFTLELVGNGESDIYRLQS